jgi:hypothetical protein
MLGWFFLLSRSVSFYAIPPLLAGRHYYCCTNQPTLAGEKELQEKRLERYIGFAHGVRSENYPFC